MRTKAALAFVLLAVACGCTPSGRITHQANPGAERPIYLASPVAMASHASTAGLSPWRIYRGTHTQDGPIYLRLVHFHEYSPSQLRDISTAVLVAIHEWHHELADHGIDDVHLMAPFNTPDDAMGLKQHKDGEW